MSDKKNRGRQALDVGSALVATASVLVDVGGTGGVLAGGKLLWDAVTAGIGRRRLKQAQAYLECLAEALGDDNAAALAVELDQAGENEIWETIEEGFRAMMGAINETAKRAIAVLVADYVVRQELPDREFQLIGALISNSDDQILKCLYLMSDQLMQVYASEIPEHISNAYYSYEILCDDQGYLYAQRHFYVGAERQKTIESDGDDGFLMLDESTPIQLLDRYEFGNALRGALSGPRPAEGRSDCLEVYLKLSVSDERGGKRFRQLHRYLKTILFSPENPSQGDEDIGQDHSEGTRS